jgi:hypothetical protein
VAATFEVVLADLASMVGTFRTEAAGYRALVPGITPVPVDSGDGSLNEAIASVFDSLAALHELMADSIDQHAYAAREVDNRFLYDDLSRETW